MISFTAIVLTLLLGTIHQKPAHGFSFPRPRSLRSHTSINQKGCLAVKENSTSVLSKPLQNGAVESEGRFFSVIQSRARIFFVAFALLAIYPTETMASTAAAPPSVIVVASENSQEDSTAMMLDAFGSQLTQTFGSVDSSTNGKNPSTALPSTPGTEPSTQSSSSNSDMDKALQQLQKRKRVDPRTHG